MKISACISYPRGHGEPEDVEGRTKRIVTIQGRCLPRVRETPRIRVGTTNREGWSPEGEGIAEVGHPLLFLVEPGRVNRERRHQLDN